MTCSTILQKELKTLPRELAHRIARKKPTEITAILRKGLRAALRKLEAQLRTRRSETRSLARAIARKEFQLSKVRTARRRLEGSGCV